MTTTVRTTPTPGPWEWDGKFTVTIPVDKGRSSFRTEPANARLIAAAPELLAALKDLLATSQMPAGLERHHAIDRVVARAVHAIAKAEGAA